MTKPFAGTAERIKTISVAGVVAAGLMAPALFTGGSAHAEGGSEVISKTTPSQPPAPPAPPVQAQPQPQPPAPVQTPSTAAKPPTASPVGAGNGWDTKTQEPVSVSGEQVVQDSNAIAVVQKINAYFNDLKDLQGTFLQTDPDTKQKKGKFYFERPGKVRFDYAPPNPQKIISDGKYLAIEDHDLKTSDRYPLESTPFRMLLAKDVDFLRDARILGLDQGQDVVILTVEDRSEKASGQIRLFFSWPDVKLKEWIITDPQGLNTRIEILSSEANKSVSADLFKFSDIALPTFRQ